MSCLPHRAMLIPATSGEPGITYAAMIAALARSGQHHDDHGQ
jgi:hypothetical protein